MRRHVMKAMSLRSPRHFGRNRRGASAIEFALIAPLMLGLYIGCVEISEGVADRKVTLTAGTLANLTSQVTTLTTADIAAKISCLKIDATGIARVTWGEATTGVTKRAPGEVVTIPANLAVPNSYLVFTEVSYQYVPVTGFSPGFSHISASGITLSDVMYMAPRISPPQYGARKCV
ncbi:MAG: TadE/TadG family type IV pilus assembly protein [Pseudolabrys sp.]